MLISSQKSNPVERCLITTPEELLLDFRLDFLMDFDEGLSLMD